MSVTLSEVLLLVDDYSVSNSGQVNADRKKRAVDQAINFFKRKMGLPSDELIYSFLFSQDQLFYDMPTDFDEELQLLYHNPDFNTPENEWENRAYPEVLQRTGSNTRNIWSFTSINGRRQLVMSGRNLRQGGLLFSLDAVGDWVAAGDASNLTLDENQKYEGSGSLNFDITNSSGGAIIRNSNIDINIEDLVTYHGYLKFWTWLTDDRIDDITVRLYEDTSNYYTIVADTDDAGDDFAEDEWIKIGFPMDDAVLTGSPDPTAITRIDIEYDLGSGFTSAADFRLDDIFTSFPDEMDLIYYSQYKGTDTTGVTNKKILTVDTDKLAIGEFFPDIADLIARRAALNLWPGLRGDKDWFATYRDELKDFIGDAGRKFPRKRVSKYLRTRLMRS